MNEKNAVKKTKRYLIEGIQEDIEKIEKIAIPFSGSLDSSLVAFIVKNYTNSDVLLYTIGFPDCYDFKVSKGSAKLLNLSENHLLINLDKNDLATDLKEYLEITNDEDKVSISYTLPFYILLKQIYEENVITGHGADTLFGGFYKYHKIKDLRIKIEEYYKEFLEMLPKREYKIAKHFDKKLILPFVDRKLADFILTQPKNYFIRDGVRKYLLREVARDLGVPSQIVNQPKKAIQYSTGVLKSLKKIW